MHHLDKAPQHQAENEPESFNSAALFLLNLAPCFLAFLPVGILLPHEDPSRPCAVCLTVLCQAPASSSSPIVAIETVSHGKVQASGSSGKRTVRGSDSRPRHTVRQLPKQQKGLRMVCVSGQTKANVVLRG